MEMSSGEWLSDLALLEDQANIIIQQCQMMSPQVDWEGLNNCVDPTDLMMEQLQPISYSGQPGKNEEVVKVAEINSNTIGWASCASSSGAHIISFGSSDCHVDHVNPKKEPIVFVDHDHNYGDQKSSSALGSNNQKRKNYTKKFGSMGLCSQEHVLAERKRREKMSQRFHALSTLIPGLKKMDKATILGDATKYLKQLEERVKELEEQTASRRVESVVLAKKMQQDMMNLEEGNSSSDENLNNSHGNSLLEIEARASNKNVLVRIHSQKDQGLVPKVLNHIEKLHLRPLNCSTMPFGGLATDITIIAQMEDEFCLTMKELVMHLRLGLQDLLCLHK